MSQDVNPYAPPQAELFQPLPVDAQAEAIRKAHLNHEASIQSIGSLMLLGGILLLCALGMMVFFAIEEQAFSPEFYIGFAITAVWTFFGLITGFGLRSLAGWARITAIIAGVISVSVILLALSTRLMLFLQTGNMQVFARSVGQLIGLAIQFYILYLLLHAKGKMVVSPEYKQIIAATPHIQYRTSWILLFFVGLLLFLFCAGFIAFIAGR